MGSGGQADEFDLIVSRAYQLAGEGAAPAGRATLVEAMLHAERDLAAGRPDVGKLVQQYEEALRRFDAQFPPAG